MTGHRFGVSRERPVFKKHKESLNYIRYIYDSMTYYWKMMLFDAWDVCPGEIAHDDSHVCRWQALYRFTFFFLGER